MIFKEARIIVPDGLLSVRVVFPLPARESLQQFYGGRHVLIDLRDRHFVGWMIVGSSGVSHGSAGASFVVRVRSTRPRVADPWDRYAREMGHLER